jgi:NTE family protein
MTHDRHKTAVILSGGGAYGAYEVGILKGLTSGSCPHMNYIPIDADIYAGTSAGAINCAVFVGYLENGAQYAAQYLEDFWVNHVAEGPGRCGNGVYRVRAPFMLPDPDCILRQPVSTLDSIFGDSLFFLQESIRRGAGFLTSTGSLTRRSLETIDISVLIAATRIREGLAQAVSLDGISRSGCELRIMATNFETGELSVFDELDIVNRVGIEAILASAAIPAVVPPVKVDGQLHVDGGAIVNTPLLREVADSDIVHLVYMDPDIAAIPIERIQNTIGVLDRILVVHNAYRINQDLETLLHINESLEMIESISGLDEIVDSKLKSFLKGLSRIFRRERHQLGPYHTIAVHRYHPREDLGGALGFMNLGQQHIRSLIERGYHDAVNHDCVASGCIIPEISASKTREGRQLQEV